MHSFEDNDHQKEIYQNYKTICRHSNKNFNLTRLKEQSAVLRSVLIRTKCYSTVIQWSTITTKRERVFPYNVDTLMHLLNVGPLVSYLILSLHKCTSSLSTVKKLSKTKMRQTDVLALMHQNILTSVHRNSKQ